MRRSLSHLRRFVKRHQSEIKTTTSEIGELLGEGKNASALEAQPN